MRTFDTEGNTERSKTEYDSKRNAHQRQPMYLEEYTLETTYKTKRTIDQRDYLWYQEEYRSETPFDTKKNTVKRLPMTPRGIHITDYL